MTACHDLLVSQTSGADPVVGSEFSQTNNAVYTPVCANGAPRCRMVSDDASNPSVMSVGDEGAALRGGVGGNLRSLRQGDARTGKICQ
jgi:hypothetical protein